MSDRRVEDMTPEELAKHMQNRTIWIPKDSRMNHEDKLGKRVRVTNPHSPIGGWWEGTLIGLAHDPSLIVDADDGHRFVLPQSFTVEELPEQPSPDYPMSVEIAVQMLRDHGFAVVPTEELEALSRRIRAVLDQ